MVDLTRAWCIKTILAGLMVLTATLSRADFTASVDQTDIEEGDLIVLTLTSTDEYQGRPDLSVLEENFDILSQSESSQVVVTPTQTQTNVTWRLELLPLRPGTVTVPAINNGTRSTAPIKITISSAPKAGTSKTRSTAQQAPDLLLTVSVDDATPYVQQEVQLTLSVHYAKPIRNGQLSPIELPSALIQQVDQRNQRQSTIGGKDYTIEEMYYLLTPQKSGPLVIEPIRLVADLVENTGRSMLSFGRAQRRATYSEPLTLQVRPKPASYPPQAAWLPAKNVILGDQWHHKGNSITVGEAISRTVTLQLTGQTARIVPAFSYENLDNVKVYQDQSIIDEHLSIDGTRGQITQSLAIVPLKAGPVTLPEKTLYWWNTERDKLETITLPGGTWQAVASGSNNASPPQDKALKQTHPALTSDEPLDTPPVNTQVKNSTEMSSLNHALIWALAIVLVLWISSTALLLYFFLHRQKPNAILKASPTPSGQTLSLKKARQHVLSLIDQEDTEALPHAIVRWGCLHYGKPQMRTLGEVIRASDDAELKSLLIELEQLRYKQSSSGSFDHQKLAHIIRALEPRKQNRQSPSEHTLAPLYP